MFYSRKSQFGEKNLALPVEKFSFLVLARIITMLQQALSIFSTIICQGVAYRRLKQTKLSVISKSGHGRLREVVDYKRFQI